MKTLGHKLLLILILIVVGLPSTTLADPYDPSDDLNLFFGSRCESFNGPLNSLASSQAGYLKSVIASMMNDPACAGVSKALQDLANLNLDNLQEERQAELSVDQLRDQSQALEATLRAEAEKNPQDADYIGEIKTALRTVNVQLIKAKSNPNDASRQRRLGTLKDLQSYALGLFTELETNSACSGKHPNLGAQIGAQVVALSSHLASGVVGPVLLAAGSVIDRYVTYLRNRPLAREYKEVVDSRMTQAIGCALEGLSSTYCQARDVQAVVRYNAANQQVDPTCKPENEGARLIGIDLASFSDWVSRLSAGSAPSSPAQGSEKKDAVQLKADFDKLKIDMDAQIAKTSQKLANGNIDKNSELIALLSGLETSAKGAIGTMVNMNGVTQIIGNGPLRSLFAADPDCGPMAFVYTNGAQDRCVKSNQGESCFQCSQRLYGNGNKVPSLEEVKAAKDTLISRAGPSVAAEAALNQESNPQLVLTKAFGVGANNRRPIGFLRGTKTYLTFLANQAGFNTGARSETIADLSKRVSESLCLLERTADCPPVTPPPSPTPSPDPAKVAAERVTALSDNLSPSRDIFYISNALYELVKQDLDDRISKGEIDESLALVMQLSTSDSLGELITNQIGLDATNNKAMYAKTQTMKNLQSLGDLFKDQIVDGLENAQRDKSESLALDCIRALIVPSAPKFGRQDISKYCRGQTWKSIRNPKISLSFDELLGKDESQRACSIYDFYRKTKVRGFKSN